MAWYFEEGDAVLLRVWCGTLRRWRDTFKRVVWYFEDDGVVLQRWRCVMIRVI